MKHWKYYSLTDSKKEAVGTLYAADIDEAYAIACRMKQLPLGDFEKLFGIERI